MLAVVFPLITGCCLFFCGSWMVPSESLGHVFLSQPQVCVDGIHCETVAFILLVCGSGKLVTYQHNPSSEKCRIACWGICRGSMGIRRHHSNNTPFGWKWWVSWNPNMLPVIMDPALYLHNDAVILINITCWFLKILFHFVCHAITIALWVLGVMWRRRSLRSRSPFSLDLTLPQTSQCSPVQISIPVHAHMASAKLHCVVP